MRWFFEEITPPFMRTWDDVSEPLSMEIIPRYLNKRFGQRLTSREAAERKLKHKFFLLLFEMSTPRNGWNKVNDVASTEERCVLPRCIDYAPDSTHIQLRRTCELKSLSSTLRSCHRATLSWEIWR